MKKCLFSMVVIAIFAIGFAASGDEGGSDERCGTYKIVDKSGSVFHLTLKGDESGTMTTESNSTYYCSWSADGFSHCIRINFSDKKPAIAFPGGTDDNVLWTNCLKDGYLYREDALEAKNPNWRLKAEKIK